MHKRNTTAIEVFLQLLQVACKFSLVLQRCIAGVRTNAIQLQCKKNFLYCSCILVVLHLCGPLKTDYCIVLARYY